MWHPLSGASLACQEPPEVVEKVGQSTGDMYNEQIQTQIKQAEGWIEKEREQKGRWRERKG